MGWLHNVYFIFIILFAVKESYYTKPIEETKPQPERSAIVSAHSKTAGTTSSIKGILVTACIHYFVCLNIKFNFFMELHFITKLSSVIVFEFLHLSIGLWIIINISGAPTPLFESQYNNRYQHGHPYDCFPQGWI